jgi:potassium/hydrogen antiporter
LVVQAGSAADRTSIENLEMGENAWISMVSRTGQLIQVRGDTVLASGDEVLLLVEPDDADHITRLFTEAVPAPQ